MLTEVPKVKLNDPGFEEIVWQSVEIGHLHVWAPHIKLVAQRVIREFEKFCALPLEVKLGYEDADNGHQVGYSPDRIELSTSRKYLGKEIGADRKEHWMARVKDLPENHPERLAWPSFYPNNIWPAEIPGFKTAISDLYEMSLPIGMKVLQVLAERLEKGSRYFDDLTLDGPTIMRIIHYFSLTPEELEEQIWAGDHCDINLLTGLLGSTGSGLWLQRGDGVWIPLARPEGYITFQYGDMLERDSDGIVKSTRHKVVAPAPYQGRYSIALFIHPLSSNLIGIEGSNDPSLTRMKAGDALLQRLKATGMAY